MAMIVLHHAVANLNIEFVMMMVTVVYAVVFAVHARYRFEREVERRRCAEDALTEAVDDTNQALGRLAMEELRRGAVERDLKRQCEAHQRTLEDNSARVYAIGCHMLEYSFRLAPPRKTLSKEDARGVSQDLEDHARHLVYDTEADSVLFRMLRQYEQREADLASQESERAKTGTGHAKKHTPQP